MLSVSALCSQRGDKLLFADLSFQLAAGEWLYLRGANGTGKTTLLQTLATLTPPLAGHILWQGQADYLTELHYLGHRDGLKEELSVLHNLQLACHLASQRRDESTLIAHLATVGMARLADLPVKLLSRGQKRRAALARLIALPRPLWLLDEPLAALDTDAQTLLGELLARHLQTGGSAVITSHQALPGNLPTPQTLTLGAEAVC